MIFTVELMKVPGGSQAYRARVESEDKQSITLLIPPGTKTDLGKLLAGALLSRMWPEEFPFVGMTEQQEEGDAHTGGA